MGFIYLIRLSCEKFNKTIPLIKSKEILDKSCYKHCKFTYCYKFVNICTTNHCYKCNHFVNIFISTIENLKKVEFK